MSKKKNKEPDFPENGFVIVASRLERFYIAAVELAKSIKLFWPEAHITIYVDNEDCWEFNIPSLAKSVRGGKAGEFMIAFARQADGTIGK